MRWIRTTGEGGAAVPGSAGSVVGSAEAPAGSTSFLGDGSVTAPLATGGSSWPGTRFGGRRADRRCAARADRRSASDR